MELLQNFKSIPEMALLSKILALAHNGAVDVCLGLYGTAGACYFKFLMTYVERCAETAQLSCLPSYPDCTSTTCIESQRLVASLNLGL